MELLAPPSLQPKQNLAPSFLHSGSFLGVPCSSAPAAPTKASSAGAHGYLVVVGTQGYNPGTAGLEDQ